MAINELLSQLEISPWILGVIIIWSIVWKLLALWKSARNNHLTWFIVLGIFNTVGILEILYFYIFSEKKEDSKQENTKKKQTTKSRKNKK
jgi:methionyl-tRNA synthetase